MKHRAAGMCPRASMCSQQLARPSTFPSSRSRCYTSAASTGPDRGPARNGVRLRSSSAFPQLAHVNQGKARAVASLPCWNVLRSAETGHARGCLQLERRRPAMAKQRGVSLSLHNFRGHRVADPRCMPERPAHFRAHVYDIVRTHARARVLCVWSLWCVMCATL